MLHVEMAVNETWHQGMPLPTDGSGTRTYQFPRLSVAPNKYNPFALYSHRLCLGIVLISGENVSVSNYNISVGGHNGLRS
jgi:hypothetical protein